MLICYIETSEVHYSSEREDYYVNLLEASAVFRKKNDRHLVATSVHHMSTARPSPVVYHSIYSHNHSLEPLVSLSPVDYLSLRQNLTSQYNETNY